MSASRTGELEKPTSLLQPADQADLLTAEHFPDGQEIWNFKRGKGVYGQPGGECVGEYTGERFFKSRPFEYGMTVRLLGAGIGILATAAIMRISPSTVIAVRNREGVSIKAEKGHLSRLAHVFSNLAFEGATDLLLEVLNDPSRRGEASFKEVSDLIKAATTATATGQLLAGEATGRVEIPESKKPAHDDFNAELAKLRDATPTGLSVEKNGAPIEASPAAEPGLVPEPPGQIGAAGERPDARTDASADGQSFGQTHETP